MEQSGLNSVDRKQEYKVQKKHNAFRLDKFLIQENRLQNGAVYHLVQVLPQILMEEKNLLEFILKLDRNCIGKMLINWIFLKIYIII